MAKPPPKHKLPKRKRNPKPPPKCKAMLLCERAIIEHMTGNVSLINTFGGFALPSFPGQTNPFNVFLQLTGGSGRYAMTAELIDLRDNLVIGRAEGIEMKFDDRLQLINVMFG